MGEEKKISPLSARFLQILEDKNITAYKLAKEIKEISAPTVHYIKSGKIEPSRKVINALLLYFPDVNPEWLNHGVGNRYINNAVDFLLHREKPNILETYTLDEIVSFVIQNEKLVRANCDLWDTYIKTLEQSAINNFLRSNLKSDS
jgi:hypothetical protein